MQLNQTKNALTYVTSKIFCQLQSIESSFILPPSGVSLAEFPILGTNFENQPTKSAVTLT